MSSTHGVAVLGLLCLSIAPAFGFWLAMVFTTTGLRPVLRLVFCFSSVSYPTTCNLSFVSKVFRTHDLCLFLQRLSRFCGSVVSRMAAATPIVIKIPDVLKTALPSDGAVPSTCSYCCRAPVITCDGCHANRYCSVECQNQERESHRLVCSQYAEVKDDTRPDKNHFRALWLPADSTKPEWFWLKTEENEYQGGAIHSRSLAARVGANGGSWKPLHNDTFTHGLTHGLVLLHHKAFGFKRRGYSSDKPNMSIAAMAPAGYMRPYWSSAVVAAYQEQGPDSTLVVKDLDMADFRKVVDAFRLRHDNPCVTDPFRVPFRLIRNAVKINSVGDRRLFGLEPHQVFQQVTIPFFPYLPHGPELLSSGQVMQWASPVAVTCGLPWMCRVFCPTHNYSPSEWPTASVNPEAGRSIILRSVAFPDSRGHVKSCTIELPNPGTVIIAHMLGAPIEIAHVRAFIKVMDSIPPASLAAKTSHGLKRRFEQAWNEAKKIGHMDGLDVTSARSPWGMMPHYTREDLRRCNVNWDWELDTVQRINKPQGV